MHEATKILRTYSGILIILVVTAGIYARTYDFGFLNWDDHLYVGQNGMVNGQAPLAEAFTRSFEGHYHPFVHLSLRADYLISRGAAWFFHLHNLLLHLLNILLVWRILHHLFPRSDVSLWVTMLFALHPLQVEAVAWVTARKDVLYSFWFLIALYCWVRRHNGRMTVWYYAALLAFIFSVLSKGQGIMLAAVLPILDYYRGGKVRIRTNILPYIPFLLIAGAFAWVAIRAQVATGYTTEASFSTPFGFLTGYASWAILSYIIRPFAPIRLSAYYPYPVPGQDIPELVFWGAIPLAALIVSISIFLWIKRRPEGFGLMFFLILLAPMVRFVPVSNFITADRYTYLAGIGIFLALTFVLQRSKKIYRTIFFILFGSAMLYLSILRIGVWQDSLSLLNDTLEKHPSVVPALNARGDVLLDKGKPHEALDDFTKAITLRPSDPRAYGNRGRARAQTGRLPEAIEDFTIALNLRPGYRPYLMNRAIAFRQEGNSAAAIQDLHEILESYPADAQALGMIAYLLYDKGDYDQSMFYLDRALKQSPGSLTNRALSGIVMARQGRCEQALERFLDPLYPDFSTDLMFCLAYAHCLEESGLQDKARHVLETLVRQTPSLFEAWGELAAIYLRMENYTLAEEAAGRSIEMSTGYGFGYYIRGMARTELGKAEEACTDLNAATMLGIEDAGKIAAEVCD